MRWALQGVILQIFFILSGVLQRACLVLEGKAQTMLLIEATKINNEPYLKLCHKQKMAALVGDSRDFCMGDHWTKIFEWPYLSQKTEDIEL